MRYHRLQEQGLTPSILSMPSFPPSRTRPCSSWYYSTLLCFTFPSWDRRKTSRHRTSYGGRPPPRIGSRHFLLFCLTWYTRRRRTKFSLFPKSGQKSKDQSLRVNSGLGVVVCHTAPSALSSATVLPGCDQLPKLLPDLQPIHPMVCSQRPGPEEQPEKKAIVLP